MKKEHIVLTLKILIMKKITNIKSKEMFKFPGGDDNTGGGGGGGMTGGGGTGGDGGDTK